ncbi:MAG: hypothetical protein WA803_15750 [Steroidobacteraceae bacterium]
MNAADDQGDDQRENAQTPIPASLPGCERRLEVRQCLLELSSIVLERGRLFFDKVSGRVDAGLVNKELRALPGAIDDFLCGIDGRDTFRFPHGGYLGRQIGGLAIAAYLSLVHGVRFAWDEFEGLAGVLPKYGVGLVIAFVGAPSSILHSRAPG